MINVKKDFPIFKNNPGLVYLDSAATSQKPQAVIDAIRLYYENYNANVRRGLYPIAEKATEKVEQVRKQVAKFINAKDPSEIIFVRNATEAINIVAQRYGIEMINCEKAITTTIMEHHSNFVPWQERCLWTAADFQVLDIDSNGILQYDNISKKSVFLAITHVSNVLGTINPIKEIIKKARQINPQIVVLVDAAQSVPHMSVDVQDLNCDFLAFSGHKMMASTGIGILYGKKHLLEKLQPFLYGGDMIHEVTVQKTTFATIPSKFEAGTPDIAGIISLGAAIEYIKTTGIENIRKHEERLLSYALEKMEKIDGLTIYGPKDVKKRSGVISFTLNGIHPHDIAQILGDIQICIRAGHHCAMPLHATLGVPATARASFYIYNDEEDIDKLIEGIEKAKKTFSV